MQNFILIDVFYYILDNHDTQRGAEIQSNLLDDEFKNLSLTQREKIGQDATGIVYRCENIDTGVEIAMKKLNMSLGGKHSPILLNALYEEMQILRKIKHKHIVKYYGILHENDSVSLIMEYVKGGSIREVILRQGAFQEKDASKYCQQILQGLAYIHEKGIVHGNLRCANILLDNSNNCKLVDSAISRRVSDIISASSYKWDFSACYWMSPEVVERREYTLQSDIWSFGCTVLEMLNTEPPYHTLHQYAAMYEIVTQDLVPSVPYGTSDHCKIFIMKCLQREPQSRPSAKDLLDYNFISLHNELQVLSL